MRRDIVAGAFLGAAAYVWWGVAPFYFRAVEAAGEWEVLCHRVVWSVVSLAVLIQLRQGWPRVVAVLRDLRTLRVLLVTGLLVSANWFIFIYAISIQRLADASLGYFVNPLLSVLLGFVILRERLRRWQWTAIVLAACGVAYQVVLLGELPWIALVLAATFGTYGLLRKVIRAGPVTGLFVETLVAFPFAMAFLVIGAAKGQIAFGQAGLNLTLLLAAGGIVTAVPLVLFAHAAQRIQLATLGFLQYLAPSLQLMVAVVFFGEVLPMAKWHSLFAIWGALAIFVADAAWHLRKSTHDTAPVVPPAE